MNEAHVKNRSIKAKQFFFGFDLKFFAFSTRIDQIHNVRQAVLPDGAAQRSAALRPTAP